MWENDHDGKADYSVQSVRFRDEDMGMGRGSNYSHTLKKWRYTGFGLSVSP